MTDKACSYLFDMLNDGFMPNKVFFTSLINQLLREGDVEFSFRLVNLMDGNQIGRDRITYIALVGGVSRNITPFKRLDLVKSRYARAREIFLGYLRRSFVIPRGINLSIHCGSPCEMKYFALFLVQEIKRHYLYARFVSL